METELFPGQVEVADMTLEHLACLVSPARVEVFWNISGVTPRSISEIAAQLGRSASSVTYHVAELVKVGLVIQVGERKKRSRMEALYVLGSRRGFMTKSVQAPVEYRELSLEMIAGLLRLALRERTELTKSYGVSNELESFGSVRRLSTRATPERARAFRDSIVQQIRDFVYEPPDPDGVHMSIMFIMSPSIMESKRVSGAKAKPRGIRKKKEPRA